MPHGSMNMADTSQYPFVQKKLHILHNILEKCHRKLHKTDSHTQRNNEPGFAASEQDLQEASKLRKVDSLVPILPQPGDKAKKWTL